MTFLRPLVLSLGLLSLFACGDDDLASDAAITRDGDSTPDTSTAPIDTGIPEDVANFDAGAPVPGPDGTSGICCPITQASGCSPGPGYVGGWAASLAECAYDPVGCCDGFPHGLSMDDAGCSVMTEGGAGGDRCGTYDAGMDSGAGDAGPDAGE